MNLTFKLLTAAAVICAFVAMSNEKGAAKGFFLGMDPFGWIGVAGLLAGLGCLLLGAWVGGLIALAAGAISAFYLGDYAVPGFIAESTSSASAAATTLLAGLIVLAAAWIGLLRIFGRDYRGRRHGGSASK